MPRIDSASSVFFPMVPAPAANGDPPQTPVVRTDSFAHLPVPLVHIEALPLDPSAGPVSSPSPMLDHRDAHRYLLASFTGPLFRPSGPSMNDVNQGQAGNCYFLSALAALAQTDPAVIQDMVHMNVDGSYTVRFYRQTEGVVAPNPVAVSVRVSPDFLVRTDYDRSDTPYSYTPVYATSLPEGTFVGHPSLLHENAMWVPVVEKAYAVFRGGSYDLVGRAGWSHEAMASLLGRNGFRKSIHTLGQDATWALLKEALATHSPVTLSTWTDAEHASMFTNSGLVPGHAYAFIDASERDGQRYVTLKNPWGHKEPGNDGVDDGKFELSLDETAHSFDIIGYAPKHM